MGAESEQDEQIPHRLSADLGSLYSQPLVVPARVNGVVLNQARADLAKRGRWRALRWVGAAAAAACVVLVGRFMLLGPLSPDDIDQNRRVDIVDALVLARQIEAGGGQDLTGDGQADQADVDAIAMLAVSLNGGVQ